MKFDSSLERGEYMNAFKQCWMKGLGVLVIGLFILPEVSDARGLRRRDCFSRRNRSASMGRMMGDRNARRLVKNAWARMGASCDQVDRLAALIADTPLARPFQSGDFAGCFYLGYTDALWDELDQVYRRCGDQCFGTGTDIGRISAQGYCAASIAVDGLLDPGFIAQPPLPFCGQNLVFGCKSEYVSVATWEMPACQRYTQGRFERTFENSVRQDCFVPFDVPVFDQGSLF
tara:strand:+ start:1402 stop:2094 length:693 start_codon:yes stop_codon:yes gene_type:complete